MTTSSKRDSTLSPRVPAPASRDWLARLAALPANRWFAYGAVLLVQLRAMWGIWDKDLTVGDTSYYFATANLWPDGLQVNFAWSPLYTAFLGTVDWVVGGTVAAIHVHRVLIVVALALIVLAVLRKLVAPWAALVGALWWASLPIVYDSLYEVHLFAAMPLMIAVLLLTNDPSMKRRGVAIGFLLASAVVVRNEAGFVAVLLVAAMAVAGWHLRPRDAKLPLKRIAVAFGIPLIVVAAIVGLSWQRSAIKGEVLSNALDAKHTRNVCQVFTFSYQQRHPADFTGSPWTGCQDLMVRFFDEPEPTLTEAWRQNPGAMVDFTTWNMRLFPQGVQVALFNSAAGNLNPDYPLPRLGTWVPAALGLLLFALLIAGALALRKEWPAWAARIHRQRWAWAALVAIGVVVVAVVILTQRPRPSYMFGLSVGIIAVAALAGAVLARRYGATRWLSAAAAVLPVGLLIAMPVHFEEVPTPFTDAYERLSPAVDSPSRNGLDEVLVSSVPATPLCFYLKPNESCDGLDFQTVAAGAEDADQLAAALDSTDATLLYVDYRVAGNEALREFLDDPGGWEVAGSGTTEAGPWTVLARQGT